MSRRLGRLSAGLMLAAAAGVVTGCGHVGGTSGGAPAPSAPRGAGSSASSPAPVSVSASPSDGTVLPAGGSLLQPPRRAVSVAAGDDCRRLLTEPASLVSIRDCTQAAGPQGTVTADEEAYAHTQEWDVWHRVGDRDVLVLGYAGNSASTPGLVFHAAAVGGDHEPKILAVELPPETRTVASVDIVEETGRVVAHVGLGAGGVIGPGSPSGIRTWVPAGTGRYIERTVTYAAGAWRLGPATVVAADGVPAYPDGDGFGGGVP